MIAVLTTVGTIGVLIVEAGTFFAHVPVVEFLTGRRWAPLFVPRSFGILPLLAGSLLVAAGAAIVALPIGLASAIHLSEYAAPGVRAMPKPALEVLAGVPMVVYGFFALPLAGARIERRIIKHHTRTSRRREPERVEAGAPESRSRGSASPRPESDREGAATFPRPEGRDPPLATCGSARLQWRGEGDEPSRSPESAPIDARSEKLPKSELAGVRRGERPPPPDLDTDSVESAVELLLEEVVEAPEPMPHLLGRSLRGRCVIVTGAATGIGRAIALEFAGHGANVAFNYFGDEDDGTLVAEAERTLRDLAQLEVRVHCEECDVRDADAVAGFVDRARGKLGGIHVLVNNAGIARDRALWRLTDEQWRAVIDTNLTGAFHMIRAVAPHLRAQGDGKIVNVSSVHAFRSEFGLANYCASKAGLLALTRSAALELGPSNVNVNAVAPGYIRTTRLTEGVPAEILDRAREKSPLGRLGDPQDVAHAVLFLCSEMARHITGAVIPVDGGHIL